MQDLLRDGESGAPFTLVLAHGAGAPMDSPFMAAMAHGLAERGLGVVRFEFPYMQARRRTGRRQPPDAAPVLMDHWQTVIAEVGYPRRLVIGGKSMGGRIASLVADELGVAGLVCLGYPFHPPGKPDRLRTAHLNTLRTPTLILQGSRDPFGNRDEVESYGLSSAIRVVYLADGDHSFKPRVRSGRTLEQNLKQAVAEVAGFVESVGQGPGGT